MSDIIIIKKEDMGGQMGPDAMVNTIGICDCILKDKNDGDEVEVTVKGTLIDHDGMRFIAAHTVEGEPVEDPDIEQDSSQEQPMDMGAPPAHAMMNAHDALTQFLQNRK